MNHNHKWVSLDIPGVTFCKCGAERYFDRVSQTYEIEEVPA